MTAPTNSGYGPAQAAGSGGLSGKRRGPLAVWLLGIITLGIYHLVWYYKINNESRKLDGRIEVDPTISLFAILFGWLIIVPPFVSYYRTGNRIATMQRAAGVAPTCSALLGLLLQVFVLSTGTIYYQHELNKVWERYGYPEPGTPVPLAV